MDQHRKRREGQEGFGCKCDKLGRRLSDEHAVAKLIGSVRLIQEYKMERHVTYITTEPDQETQGRQGKNLDEM